jgi:phosphatidylinositol dimannoside acyltransferase
VPSGRRPPGEGRLVQLVYYGYVAGSKVAQLIPERVAYGLALLLGSLAARISKKRAVVARNLSRITGLPPESPALQRKVVDAYRSYARYWLETFRLVREGPEFFLERFVCHGQENLDKQLASGKGVVLAIGHLGNWDAAGAWAGASGYRVVTVAEVLKPRRMFDFFVEHRAALGMRILPAEPGVTGDLAAAVEDGALVPVLADRDLKGKGVEVTFCGERTTFPAGTASVALRTEVPVMVAGIFGVKLPDGKRGWEAIVSEPIDLPDLEPKEAVRELTQRIASKYEEYVRMRPEEWHVFQPFWLVDRAR